MYTEITSNFGTYMFLLVYSLKVEKLRAFLFLKMCNNAEFHCRYFSDTSDNFLMVCLLNLYIATTNKILYTKFFSYCFQ